RSSESKASVVAANELMDTVLYDAHHDDPPTRNDVRSIRPPGTEPNSSPQEKLQTPIDLDNVH
ncbi:hypothetical protein AVEN_32420-1, partial [Araneus ventricosus]